MYASGANISNNSVAGNIMSLVYGDEFTTKYDEIPCAYCFKYLFAGSGTGNTVGSAYKWDASALSLPATILKEGCYMSMFEPHMTNNGNYFMLKGYPKLPAQKLKPYCYARMFAKVYPSDVSNTSITLPAEELADHCYEEMFLIGQCTNTAYVRSVEIMATSLRNREGSLYKSPMKQMFQNTNSNQFTSSSYRWGNKITIYFDEWAASSTTDTDAPTYNWWGGYYGNAAAYLNFYHVNNLPQTKTTSGSSTSKKASYFPQYCTLNPGTDAYGNTIDSVVFNCAANEGYWNEGLTYNANLRRVVRSDYTMKTVPAAPYNKDGKRFIGWFTSASGEGSLVTENQLKAMTSGITVFARFASDSEYTLYIEPSDKATITATDGTDNFTAGTFYLRTASEAARTITLSYSDVTSGYSFYKYTKDGSEIVGNTATFGTSKDLTLGAIVTGTSSSESKSVTVYQAGTGAGTSNQYDLPAQAVDLGAAGIWAKYNVDKTNTETGFAASETATGSWFSWGTLGMATGAGSGAGWYEGVSSMSAGDNLPVTDDTDAAYKYCGHNWRMATYEEWANLLANVNITTVNNYDRKLTSKTNSNYIIIPHNGSQTSSGTMFPNSIQYWTSTLATAGTNGSAKAWGYSSVTPAYPPGETTLNSDKTGSQGTGTIYTNCGIRPIFNPDARVLTIHSNGYTYTYNCELYQQMTITANAAEGFSFKEWQDAAGNVVSTSNQLVVKMYENLTYTAVYKESAGAQHEVVFYDYDGENVLERKNVYEDAAITYTGETPTRSGYDFVGWDRALGTMGKADVSFTAQYVQTFTLTLSGSNMSFTMTADGYAPQTTSGTYRSGTDVTITATVTNDAYKFSKWSDDVVISSRVVKLTENTALSASYRLVSDNQSLDIYQGITADKTKILYDLSDKTGLDSKTYKLVDMGYGVAWADRNVGATEENGLGYYYNYGGIEPIEAGAACTYLEIVSTMNAGDILPDDTETAKVVMGSNWHMPTKAEWQSLLDNTTYSGTVFTSKSDNKTLTLPTGGFYGETSYDQFVLQATTNGYYWSSEFTSVNYQYYYGYAFSNAVTFSKEGDNYIVDDEGYVLYGAQVRAIYQPTYTTYTLTINVGTKKYQYICQAGQEITVTANAQENYVFSNWSDNNSTTATRTFTMNSNLTTTANFALSTQYYNVTFNKDNNTYGTLTGESSNQRVLSDIEGNTGITINGTQITISGTTITATPASSDAQYTYSFDGWYNDATNPATQLTGNSNTVTGDMTITAHFSRTVNTYTVTWKNGEATLETDENVAYGETPEYNGATNPTKASDLVYSYTFAGWNDGTTTYGLSDDLPEVSGNVTYTAVYNSADLATFDLVDSIDAGGLYNGHDYYAAIATLKDQTRKTRNVTYHRTMEEGKWHVVSLPFNFNLILNSSHPFANNIYELTDVTYSDGGYLNFEFTPMTTMMMANKPYVFYSTTEAKDVTFNGVTFAKLEKYTGDGASIDITGGSVDFINTTSRIQLTNGDKRQIYIYNNKLYYPGSDAAYMRAFRGYFYLNNITIHHVTPRMRIVLDGQTATELEMTESAGTADEVRKYMENGVMVIERNGVKYNAQGGRME